MKTKRTYTMTARAEAVEETRQRILDALYDLACERTFPDIALDDVADRAGVSVQTILRHFGSRAALIDANIEDAAGRVRDERETPSGGVDAAVKVLLDFYDKRGDISLLMLAQERSDPQVQRLTDAGRGMHRDWVTAVFAPFNPSEETTNLLVVATDVFTWKLLRHDRRLSRRATHRHIVRLVRAVLGGDHA